MSLPCIALTPGDPCGIGPEIALKALSQPAMLRVARVILFADAGALEFYRKRLGIRVSLAPVAGIEEARSVPISKVPVISPAQPLSLRAFRPGKLRSDAGRSAVASLLEAARLARAGEVDAVVTGPVNKTAMYAAGYRVEGQTELLGKFCRVRRYEMMVHAGALRVLLLSRHLSLRRALALVRAPRILDRLRLAQEGLRDLGFSQPRIAVAGLNPHAGEGGLFGDEEKREIVPAIRRARKEGIDAHGPFSPDTIFRRAAMGEFDLVLALYHDQAFIPVKTLGFDRALTTILGLPFLRVSVIHGTAFDIAGKGVASATSMEEAIRQAASLAKRRARRVRSRR